MKSFIFLFCFRFLKTNRFSFSFYKTKRNHFRFCFRFRNENRSGVQYVAGGFLVILTDRAEKFFWNWLYYKVITSCWFCSIPISGHMPKSVWYGRHRKVVFMLIGHRWISIAWLCGLLGWGHYVFWIMVEKPWHKKYHVGIPKMLCDPGFFTYHYRSIYKFLPFVFTCRLSVSFAF